MNVPRMMRPGMPNPNANPAMINPNNSLRHLLQPQGQVKKKLESHHYALLFSFLLLLSSFQFDCFRAATAAKSIPTNDGHAGDESKYEYEHSTKSTIQRSKFRIHAMRIVASVKLWVSMKSKWTLSFAALLTHSIYFNFLCYFSINFDFRFLVAKRLKQSLLYLELKL